MAVYYRLFTKNGAIASKQPLDPNDDSLARILALSVAPPHNVVQLMRAICTAENIPYQDSPRLYRSIDRRSRMADTTRVSILEDDGPGMSIMHPLVLVVNIGAARERLAATRSPGQSERLPFIAQG